MDTASDREGEALKDLGRHVAQVKLWVASVSVCCGLTAGITGYVLLRAYFLEKAHMHYPIITGTLTIGVAFAIMFFGAKWISRLVVRSRAPAWIEAARTRHEVAADPLREFLDLCD
jgi:predicted MFS family arabinose efflux permease